MVGNELSSGKSALTLLLCTMALLLSKYGVCNMLNLRSANPDSIYTTLFLPFTLASYKFAYSCN